MQNHTTWLGFLVTQIDHYLGKKRSKGYVRSLQITLLLLSTGMISLNLVLPSLSRFEIDLHKDEKWAPNRNAPEDIIALSDIKFLMEKQYKAALADATQRSPLHFTRDFGTLESREEDSENKQPSFQKMLRQDIRKLRICRAAAKQIKDTIQCGSSKIMRWRRLQAEEWQALLLFSSTSIMKKLGELVNTIFAQYAILKKKEEHPMFKKFNGSIVRIHDIKQGASGVVDMPWENVILRTQLYRDSQVAVKLNTLAKSVIPGSSANQRRAFLKLSKSYLYRLDACRFDEKKTLEIQEIERKRVPLTDHLFQIKRGESIVRRGDVITENIYQALLIQKSEHHSEIIRQGISNFLLQVIFLLMVFYFALKFKEKQLEDISSNLIIFLSLIFFSLIVLSLQQAWFAEAKTNELVHIFGTWVPIGAFAMLFSLIFGEVFAAPFALYMAFLTFLASGYDIVSLFISTSVALSGVVLGIRLKERIHFISTALIITLINCLCLTLGYLYSKRDIFGDFANLGIFTDNYLTALSYAALSGLSSILVLGILPLYERIFNIATRFKLIELADPGHPLLRELFQRAPSTWTHTMMVAALTEKACERLKLNSVLARTGIYFHDIGKMVNAGFFIENQHLIPKPENIDKNNPALAAKVIIAHVLDGIKMAKAARLPPEVIAFIPEHHGTSIMSFFYHKALEKNRRKVNKEDFQYKGPKPQSKETAIAMVADSVEAASRSINIVNKESIENLIQKIINSKMAENQFDECDLSIRDLQVIKDSFREVLLSSFHFRPQYPDKQQTKLLENQRESSQKRTRSRSQK